MVRAWVNSSHCSNSHRWIVDCLAKHSLMRSAKKQIDLSEIATMKGLGEKRRRTRNGKCR